MISLKVIRETNLRNSVLVIICLLSLAACGGSGSGIGLAGSELWHATANANVKAAHFRKQCAAFGYKANTSEMTQCVRSQHNQSVQANARKRAAFERAYESQVIMPILNPNSNTAPDTRSVNQRKSTQRSFPILWNELCPQRHQGLNLIGHRNVKGKKVCQYG